MFIYRTRVILILLLTGAGQSVFADFGMVNRQVSRTVSQVISKNLFERMVPQLIIKNSSGKVNQMQVSSTGQYLTLLLEDNSARVWDLEYGVQRPAIKNDTKVLATVLDEKHGVFYLLHESNIIGYDVLTATKKSELSLNKKENVSDLFLTDGGSKVLLASDTGLALFQMYSKKKIWSQGQSKGELKKIITDEASGRWISLIRQESFFSSNDWIEVGDLKTGNKLYKLENEGSKILFFGFTHVQNELMVGYESGNIIAWDISKGRKGTEISLGDNDIMLMDISADGTIAYLNQNGKLVVTDLELKNSKTLNTKGKSIFQLVLVNDGRTIATAGNKGEVLFWNVTSGDEFLQLIATTEGWTVIDKIGRFDSSEKGMVNISWQVKDTEISLDSFSKKYYEPGLLASHLIGRQFINPDSSNVLAGITASPLVNIIEPVLNNRQSSGSEPVMLHVIGQGMGGGLEEIYLFHNGKKNQMGKLTTKKTKGEHGVIKEMDFKVELSRGMNIFQAVAINSMGVEGVSKEFVVNVVSGETILPTIHVVSVGINEYSDPRLNLDYSVADASAIAKIISDKKLKKYGKVEHQGLYDRQATKANIMNYLGDLKEYSQDDVLVVYAAGHGIAIDRKWYFLPYETTLKKNKHEYTKIGISAQEFKDVLVKNKAQKVFVIIDSCFSAAGLAAFRDLQDTQRHFSRDLSKSVGVVVLTAARYDQEAAELSELGHGLFTYVVTKGMDGQADIQPINKKISAHEIAEFAVKTIPVFSKKYIGASQEPAAFVIGADFELLRKIN
ncbi:MAG: caspase family protein [Methylococcales bacterium]